MAPVPTAISTSLTAVIEHAKRSGSSIRLLSSNIYKRADIDNLLLNTFSEIAKRQNAALDKEFNDDGSKNPDWRSGQGTVPPTSVPSNAIFAVFGIIGAGFVVTAIWFFMAAPNGGFVFRDGDWEEYKSTVLRRKGPNGTTLSGATASTMLGGGSVVGKRQRNLRKKFGGGGKEKYRDDVTDFTETTAYTGHTKSELTGTEVTDSLVGTETLVSEDQMTSITRGVSGAYRREKVETEKGGRRHLHAEKKAAKKAKKERKLHDEESSIGFPEESVYDPHDEAIRSYREEKPARVGGMNREADGSAFGSSYIGSDVTESLISGRQETPRNSPEKKDRRSRRGGYSEIAASVDGPEVLQSPSPTKQRGGGIRKVETVYEADRAKGEARRLRERARADQANRAAEDEGVRRNFSFKPGDDGLSAVSDESKEARRERRRREREQRHSRVRGAFDERSEVSGLTASTEDSGTKAYHHSIPGLSSAAGGDSYADERRRRRQEGANYGRS